MTSWACLFALAAVGCGDDGPPGPDPVEDNLILACIRSAACNIQPTKQVSTCAVTYGESRQARLLDPIYRCVNLSVGCTAIEKCFGPGEKCDATFQGQCSGGKAIFCDPVDGRTRAHDCEAAALPCVVNAKTHVAECQVIDYKLKWRLSPDLRCDDGICERTWQSCQTDAHNRCAGARLQACLASEWISFDCARLGLGPCEEVGTGTDRWARCTPPR